MSLIKVSIFRTGALSADFLKLKSRTGYGWKHSLPVKKGVGNRRQIRRLAGKNFKKDGVWGVTLRLRSVRRILSARDTTK